MANPIYNLEDQLMRLTQQKSSAENEMDALKNLIDNTNKQIEEFEKAISLLKKGE
jgi:peptidoglycan hydrolase CwlO-like protein